MCEVDKPRQRDIRNNNEKFVIDYYCCFCFASDFVHVWKRVFLFLFGGFVVDAVRTRTDFWLYSQRFAGFAFDIVAESNLFVLSCRRAIANDYTHSDNFFVGFVFICFVLLWLSLPIRFHSNNWKPHRVSWYARDDLIKSGTINTRQAGNESKKMKHWKFLKPKKYRVPHIPIAELENISTWIWYILETHCNLIHIFIQVMRWTGISLCEHCLRFFGS